jgi:hypothetical protein
MDYKRALQNELTDVFIVYQYRLEHPFPSPTDTIDQVRLYTSDPLFRTKVDSLVSGVMRIVSVHIDKAIKDAARPANEYPAPH